MSEQACVFCKIITKEISSNFIKETNEVIVIKDIAPKAPIHYLIIPKDHVKGLSELSKENLALGNAIFAMAKELSSELAGDGDFRLTINNGFGAGQRVFHLHAHFLAGKQMVD